MAVLAVTSSLLGLLVLAVVWGPLVGNTICQSLLLQPLQVGLHVSITAGRCRVERQQRFKQGRSAQADRVPEPPPGAGGIVRARLDQSEPAQEAENTGFNGTLQNLIHAREMRWLNFALKQWEGLSDGGFVERGRLPLIAVEVEQPEGKWRSDLNPSQITETVQIRPVELAHHGFQKA